MQHRLSRSRCWRISSFAGGALVASLLFVLAGCPAPRPTTLPGPEASASPPVAAPARQSGPEIDTVTHEGKRFTVCTVDLEAYRIELYWRNEREEPFGGFTALNEWLAGRGRKLLFAMNAGMYMEDLTPVGLYVEDGRELRPLNLRDGKSNFCLKPNGVFAITDDGAAVVESSRYREIEKSTKLATQSGPMLVIDGELHPKFSATSQSRLFRNGVGVVSPEKVVFAISEDPVNFHEFAVFFRDGLGCQDALYLDGTTSSLYSEGLGRCDCMVELGPIVAVTGECAGPR